ncbi:MAG: glycine cleavage system aminomethyltransferase GcvT [Blastocatellia bacterium]|nr:glycine cleavage system aminomethyltransferase GcvT [Blastocatellia bacterium]
MSEQLKLTALGETHRALGGKMVDFAGWEMPVQYTGLIPEHMAVRTAAGLFDVSHMGEIEVRGRDALRLMQLITCNDVAKLADRQIHYSGLMTEQGTFVDDILVHRLHVEHFFCCVNASNVDKDFAWFQQHAAGLEVEVLNSSSAYSQLALQGPKAVQILQTLTDFDLSTLKYYWCQPEIEFFGVKVFLTRTGYTGEDGFELYFAPEHTVAIWEGLMRAGKSEGLIPAGLGARNTLRLEAKMALYGHEIDDTTTPLEADLGWICKLSKGEFLGSDVLNRQKAEGLKRKLVGFEVDDRVPVRDGYPIRHNGQDLGTVTSGSPSPFLKKNIGLAYFPIELTEIGTAFHVLVRGREVPAHVVPTPFYKRAKG